MDAVEDYARRWIKREVDQDPELESLSDWVRTIRSLVQGRIHKLKNCVNRRIVSCIELTKYGALDSVQEAKHLFLVIVSDLLLLS